MFDMCNLVRVAVGVFDGLRDCRIAALNVVFDVFDVFGAPIAQAKQF